MAKRNSDIPPPDDDYSRPQTRDKKSDKDDDAKSIDDDDRKSVKAENDNEKTEKEDEKVQKSPLKKKLKIKQNKATNEREAAIEDLQRDILVRDDTIKEQNLIIVELETQIKEAVEKADNSKRATNDYKLSHMENDLRNSKKELVLHSERIEKFMEDGSKIIDEYRQNFEKANLEILDLKNEIIAKESLLRNKDDVYRRVLDDLQEARKTIGTLQMEKLQNDNLNNQLQSELDILKDEKEELENRVLELQSMQSKIQKQNLLVDELNTKFYGLSIDELGNEINQSMFDLILKLKKDHLNRIIDGSFELKQALKDDGLQDLLKELEKLKDLKEDSDDEFDHTKQRNKSREKKKKPDTPPKKEIKKESKPKSKKPEEPVKTKRTGGGFKLETDDKLEKEDKAKAEAQKKIDDAWKKRVEKAKKNNEVLKTLMNLSKNKVKKDGKWTDKPSFGLMTKNFKKLTKDPTSLLGKAMKVLTRSRDNAKISKELQEKFDDEKEILNAKIN